jgi:outer membrane protein assembly factor BamE (lipoprotein component of BamABCDE complex)
MRKILSVIILIMSAVVSLSAQTKQVRRHHSAATNVVSKQVAKEIEVGNGAFYPRTSYSYPVEDFKPGVVRVGPRTTYLKEGLTIDEVVRFLGKPFSISERTQNNTIVKMYSFRRGEGQLLIAEFENNVLVRSWLETHDNLVVQTRR